MRAEKALARLTAGTTTNYDTPRGGYSGMDKQDALLAMQGLPRLQSNMLYAKWMGDEDARKAAEREILLTIIDWPLYDEKSRSGELRKNAGILRAMTHVAMCEVLSPPNCTPCKGTGWNNRQGKECRACGGLGTREMGDRMRAQHAAEYVKCGSKNTWARLARQWEYETVLRFVQDKENHGVRYMQSRLNTAA